MSGYAFTWLASPSLFGSWEVNIIIGSFPQKIIAAYDKLEETMVGAKYEPIAMLAKQVANGTNYAMLAQQTIITKQPQKNIVVMKFNESDMDCVLYSIEPILIGNNLYGGLKIDPKIGHEIDPEFIESFKSTTQGWLGVKLEPVILLATKVVKGIDLTWLCYDAGVTPKDKPDVLLVTTNSVTHSIDYAEIL